MSTLAPRTPRKERKKRTRKPRDPDAPKKMTVRDRLTIIEEKLERLSAMAPAGLAESRYPYAPGLGCVRYDLQLTSFFALAAIGAAYGGEVASSLLGRRYQPGWLTRDIRGSLEGIGLVVEVIHLDGYDTVCVRRAELGGVTTARGDLIPPTREVIPFTEVEDE